MTGKRSSAGRPAETGPRARAAPSPTIGLALGSGGARGLAHIGVIEVLEEHGVGIDLLAGSSIGALVGGLYASGADIAELRRIASDTTLRRVLPLFDPSFRHGSFSGLKLQRLIARWVGGRRVETCSIPLAIAATDLGSGDVVLFQEGDLTSAIRASVSVPGVFRPVPLEGRWLADGGLSLPVPAEPLREMGADIVVAVDLDWERPLPHPTEGEPGPRDIAYRSIALLRQHLAAQEARYADIVVRPRFGREVRWDSFLAPDELIACGRAAMDAQTDALDAAVATWRERTARPNDPAARPGRSAHPSRRRP
jgi:NTE family protein